MSISPEYAAWLAAHPAEAAKVLPPATPAPEAPIDRDAVRQAEQAERWAAQKAAELAEAAADAMRDREARAQASEAAQVAFLRQQKALRHSARDECNRLTGAVRSLLQARGPELQRPDAVTRKLARTFLRLDPAAAPNAFDLMEAIGHSDVRLNELLVMQNAVQMTIVRAGGLEDEELAAALDSLECALWRAVLDRARYLAGESVVAYP